MKVLFVCTGNTCRSPMLKFMFEDYLRALGVSNITVDSAGTLKHQKPISKEVIEVLDNHKIVCEKCLSKHCDESVISGADIIIAVTKECAKFLENLYPERKIVSLYEICNVDISDPYGKGLAAYEEVYNLFEQVIPKIYEYISK